MTVPDPGQARAVSGEPLAILAAGGRVPIEVAQAARAAGRTVLVIGLEGEIDSGIADFPHAIAKWGQLGRIEDLVRSHGARDLLLIGTVSKRPDFGSISLDFGAIRYLPKLVRAMVGGDERVLANFAGYIEERGFRLVGVPEVAPGMVASPGAIAGRPPTGALLDDVRLAFDAARTIGRLDAGQTAVVVNNRIAALEAAEGTDAVLERVALLRKNGRLRGTGQAGVVAKCAKPQQDLRLDMPTIGPATVAAAANAGLAGLVLEAGKVIIADRAASMAAAEAAGLFIFATDDGGAR